MRHFYRGLLAAVLLAITALTAVVLPATRSLAETTLTPEEARTLSKEAWLFGMPLVMFEIQADYLTHVNKPEAAKAPVNQFVH